MVFGYTDKLKKSNLGVRLFTPKGGNHCHFWAVIGSAKGNSKLEILIVKLFSLKQKTNQYFQVL